MFTLFEKSYFFAQCHVSVCGSRYFFYQKNISRGKTTNCKQFITISQLFGNFRPLPPQSALAPTYSYHFFHKHILPTSMIIASIILYIVSFVCCWCFICVVPLLVFSLFFFLFLASYSYIYIYVCGTAD